MPFLRCPNCNKVLTRYISGYAEFHQECKNCKAMIKIFSAGQTVMLEEKLTFQEIGKMMRSNKFVDVTIIF